MVSETFKSPPYEGGGQEGVKKGPLQRFIGRTPLNLPLRKGGGKASHQTAIQERGILVLSFLKITLAPEFVNLGLSPGDQFVKLEFSRRIGRYRQFLLEVVELFLPDFQRGRR